MSRRTREGSEHTEGRGREKGGEDSGARHPQLRSLTRLLLPLHCVWEELTTNGYGKAGQEKSCKQPGFAHPHVQALLSEGDHRLGDRGPEKALVVQGP